MRARVWTISYDFTRARVPWCGKYQVSFYLHQGSSSQDFIPRHILYSEEVLCRSRGSYFVVSVLLYLIQEFLVAVETPSKNLNNDDESSDDESLNAIIRYLFVILGRCCSCCCLSWGVGRKS